MNPQPRPALLAAGELYGGVERHLLGMCTWLQRRDHEPLLLLFHDGELAAQAREIGVAPLILDARGSYDPTLPGRLARLLAAHRIDVLHAHGYRAVVNGALSRRHHRTALVRTVHGLPEPGGRFSPGAAREGLYTRLEAWASRRAGATVCYVTDDLRRRGRAADGGLATEVVPNGIDAPVAGGPCPDLLSRPGFHLVAVGRVSEVKGLDVALAALARVPGDLGVDLVIVGTGPLLEPLRRRAVDAGLAERVQFAGFRTDVYDWIAHADAVVMPSRHEGLPYTLLETMALARPVVASRVGGLAEVLVDGETGLLVTAGDPADLAAAVARLARTPELARSLGAAARDHRSRSYDLETMGSAYWRIYEESRRRANLS